MEQVNQLHLTEQLVGAAAMGSLLTLSLYNLTKYFNIHYLPSLLYSLSLFFFVAYTLQNNTFLAEAIFAEAQYIASSSRIAGPLSGAFYLVFSILFLSRNSGKFFSLARNFVLSVAGVQLIVPLVAVLFGKYSPELELAVSVLHITSLLLLFAMAIKLYQRSAVARYYLFAASALVPFLVIHLLTEDVGWVGVIENNAFTRGSLTIGAAIQGLALTAALSSSTELYKRQQLRKQQQQSESLLLTLRKEIQSEKRERERLQAEIAAQHKLFSESEQQMDKLKKTRDTFLTLLSHDLRGPIASFQVLSKVVQHQLNKGDTDRITEIMLQVEKTATQLTTLLDNLLLWAQAETQNLTLRPKYLALQPMVADIAATYASIGHEKEITVEVDVPSDFQLYADSPSVATILRNLIGNAMKFTEKGQITVTAFNKGNEAIVLVKDTGKGIKADRMKDLFEVGKKKSTLGTKGEHGNGLGLVLCYEFAMKNKGNLSIKSAEGEGTTVRLALPATKW